MKGKRKISLFLSIIFIIQIILPTLSITLQTMFTSQVLAYEQATDGTDYMIKIDEIDDYPLVTEEELKYIIENNGNCNSNTTRKENLIKLIPALLWLQDEYNISPLFVITHMIYENGVGQANAGSLEGKKNLFSVMYYDENGAYVTRPLKYWWHFDKDADGKVDAEYDENGAGKVDDKYLEGGSEEVKCDGIDCCAFGGFVKLLYNTSGFYFSNGDYTFRGLYKGLGGVVYLVQYTDDGDHYCITDRVRTMESLYKTLAGYREVDVDDLLEKIKVEDYDYTEINNIVGQTTTSQKGTKETYKLSNYITEISDDGIGGFLIEGIFYLLTFLADAVIKFVQGSVIGNWTTYANEIWEIKIGPGVIFSNKVPLLNANFMQTNPARDTAVSILQSNVATWYKALRTIALVGLLSVILYIGIKIILSSSSSEEKAKYKTMIKDWLIAVLLVFVLHYIMAFMLGMTEKLNEILASNAVEIDSNGYAKDKFINDIRAGYSMENGYRAAGNCVIYVALVILTIMFTIQYLKRLIFLAFLTMIAPLIALTYPLDKVKDSKAQAFGFWIKEYTFNCLIQPIHLIIYTLLLGSSTDFAEKNILFAVIAIGFLVPAEKIIRDMFGLKTSTSVGNLGAAAGGAAAMNLFKKLKGSPLKKIKEKVGGKAQGSSPNSNNVRTAKNSNNDDKEKDKDKEQENSKPVTSDNNKPDDNSKQDNDSASNDKNSTDKKSTSAKTKEDNKKKSGKASKIAKGAKRVGKRALRNGVNSLKSSGKWALKSLPGAVLGAGVGLAATVASGGENGLGYIAGGISAGSAMSRNLTDKATNGAGTEFSKGYHGTDEYYKRQARKEYFGSEDFDRLKENPNINQTNIKERATDLLDSGARGGQVEEALENNISGADFSSYSNAQVSSAKDMRALKDAGVDPDAMKQFADIGVTDIDEILMAKKLNPDASTDQLAKILEAEKEE